ncbi:hypothetical protein PC116_g5225 [Phytophthora cactorum]|nr:hypothetical protein PC116_g5225 [Phytophthora cactorum]
MLSIAGEMKAHLKQTARLSGRYASNRRCGGVDSMLPTVESLMGFLG